MSNAKFAVLKVYVNGEGEVVKAVDSAGEPLRDSDYSPDVGDKRLTDAVLVTETRSYCRWRLIGGRWVCT